jgi:pyrimidine operon attenuation protein / uracil phosphoribosyltransferase
MKVILSKQQISLTIKRLAHQIIENNPSLKNTVIIGLQPRGIYVSNRIVKALKDKLASEEISYGKLDITFYRDDVRNQLHIANATDIPFSIEGKKVVLIDDVLFTGRTIRAALDALLDFGRPASVELCVLINRRFSRELPIEPTYTGRALDTFQNQKVKVYWSEKDNNDTVELID